MAGTPRLALPFLAVGQAQKEFTHNESLQTIDILVGGAIEQPPLASPPADPALGACYIVDAGATGSWAGKSQSLAAWTTGGWRFVAPIEGMLLYERASGSSAVFRNGDWEIGTIRGATLVIDGQQVVGPRGAAIQSPTGGTVVDNESRATIESILSELRRHGLIGT